ncbi:MAG: 50S ribosomal protein L29 [bacterium]|nr:50S ribosomal protein L29 [bacterium]
MKINEIRQLTREEITQRLTEAQIEVQNLRFQLATHQLDNQVKVRLARRNVARLTTIIHEYELGIKTPVEKSKQ